MWFARYCRMEQEGCRIITFSRACTDNVLGWHLAPYLSADIMCLPRHVLYLSPAGGSSSFHLESTPKYVSGRFTKLIPLIWTNSTSNISLDGAQDAYQDPQHWREAESVPYLMFTDLPFLGGTVTKPGFSKCPAPPHLHPCCHSESSQGRGSSFTVGCRGVWMNVMLHSAPGDCIQHPAPLWVLDYSPALAASSGSGKTTSPSKERLVGMKHGGLIVGTNRWMENPHRMNKPHLGPGQPGKRHLCLKSGLFSWNATVEVTNLWPSDHLLNWKQHFGGQFSFLNKTCMTVFFPKCLKQTISDYGQVSVSCSSTQQSSSSKNPLILLCAWLEEQVEGLSPSKGCPLQWEHENYLCKTVFQGTENFTAFEQQPKSCREEATSALKMSVNMSNPDPCHFLGIVLKQQVWDPSMSIWRSIQKKSSQPRSLMKGLCW